MTTDISALSVESNVKTALEQIENLPFSIFPVIDHDFHCVGVITEARLRRSMADNLGNELLNKLADKAQLVYPDHTLSQAVVRMNGAKTLQLAVIERNGERKLIGIITMSDIVRAQAEAIGQSSELEKSLTPDFEEIDVLRQKNANK